MVKVLTNDDIPCDIVMLSSENEDGECYITTANLDGETNLKVLPYFCTLNQNSNIGSLSPLITNIVVEKECCAICCFIYVNCCLKCALHNV